MAESPMILEVSWNQFCFYREDKWMSIDVNWATIQAIIWGKKNAASQGNWLHVRMKIKIGWRTKVGREIR